MRIFLNKNKSCRVFSSKRRKQVDLELERITNNIVFLTPRIRR